MGAGERRKGLRIEREIVQLHTESGIHSERYPLSGASHFRDQGHDIDIYAFGREEAPLVAEVKGRKSGNGFAMLERWLGDYDLLFLRRDRQEPLVVMPWRVYKRFVKPETSHAKTAHRKRGALGALFGTGADKAGA
jgi:Holliday junction resolvase